MENNFLVSTDWLEENKESVIILDCGSTQPFEPLFIQGAIRLGMHPYLKGEGLRVMPKEEFEKLMSSLGITNDSQVILYDHGNSLFAARVWWVMKYYGHKEVRLLDGNITKWIAEKRPTTTDPTTFNPSKYEATINSNLLATVDYLKDHLDQMQIIDARRDEEFSGEDLCGNKRAGHLPGAVHVEWKKTLNEDATFKSSEELKELYKDIEDKEIITHCQAGIRGAHATFTALLAGFSNVKNYDGSMKEWANREDTPLTLS